MKARPAAPAAAPAAVTARAVAAGGNEHTSRFRWNAGLENVAGSEARVSLRAAWRWTKAGVQVCLRAGALWAIGRGTRRW